MLFNNVVFAGGGNRCFWQAGFWQSIENELEKQPENIASVSAGSAISCSLFSGCFDTVYETTLDVMAKNKKNRYWTNLLSPQPIHPHETLYRYIIDKSIDAEGLSKLHTGPKNHILLANIPSWLGPRSSTFVGISAYQLEKKLFHPVHPRLGRKLGFTSQFVTVQECQTVRSLNDLILSSSCTPPLTPLMYRAGKPVLDGGMIDNIPIHGVSAYPGNTLVLCSRPYKKFPTIEGRTYVAPSRPVPAKSWDYTNPKAVQETYLLGKQDGLNFLNSIKFS